ncbi:MAG: response regulator [Thermoleophilia bacterium]|nr:response regulator [Thermoleophilia bacterium]
MSGPRVLVVDDSAEFRRYLQLLLARAGFTTDAAGDGEEAVRRAREEPPAVIVSDLGLPGIDGVETLRRLREVCGARTFLVSGALLAPAVAAQADAVMEKPFVAEEFIARVRELAARAPHASRPAEA